MAQQRIILSHQKSSSHPGQKVLTIQDTIPQYKKCSQVLLFKPFLDTQEFILVFIYDRTSVLKLLHSLICGIEHHMGLSNFVLQILYCRYLLPIDVYRQFPLTQRGMVQCMGIFTIPYSKNMQHTLSVIQCQLGEIVKINQHISRIKYVLYTY